MKVLWVLENIREHNSFYNKFDLLMMFASVTQWKKHHPTHICELNADKLTLGLFKKLDTLRLWDSTKEIGKNTFIDKNIFWASSKLQALRNVDCPIVIMDNDFVVYRSFENYLNGTFLATHKEDGKNYYLHALDPYLQKVKHLIHRPDLTALNCSFLYLPDSQFTRQYASLSLELMAEFTKLKVPNSKYLIYAEQLLLHHFSQIKKIEFNTLLDHYLKCETDEFIKEDTGLIPYEQHNLYFRHYWKDKKKIKSNSDGFSLTQEIKQLENILKNRILIKWSLLNG